MNSPTEPAEREIDDTLAPLVFVYIAVVIVATITVLAWVYWYRDPV